MITIFLILYGISSIVPAQTQTNRPPFSRVRLLREGFFFNGIEGHVTKAPDQEKWFFKPDVDITDSKVTLKAGDTIELLPSGTLEKITAISENSVPIRLWATVTRYSNINILPNKFTKKGYQQPEVDDEKHFNKNFLYPQYFILLSDAAPENTEPNYDEEKSSLTDKSEEPSILPENIRKLLRPKRVPNLAKMKEVLKVENDIMLVDRTGFLDMSKDHKIFEIDSLGRNIEDTSFIILPCEALQRIEQAQARSLGRLRFKTAGIVTKYKGQYYMLLQRAVRTYSHGNFAR